MDHYTPRHLNEERLLAIESRVMGSIKSGELVMRARWQFAVLKYLKVGGFIAAFLGFAFLVSAFMFFIHLRVQGSPSSVGLTCQNFIAPLILLAALVAAVGYRWSTPYRGNALAMFALGLMLIAVVSQTTVLHEKLIAYGHEHRIASLMTFYKALGVAKLAPCKAVVLAWAQ